MAMTYISICFIGDIMLGRDYITNNDGTKINTFDSKFKDNTLESVYGTTLPYLVNCDLVVGNLETTITNSDEKYEKAFNYKIRPKNMHLLKINKNMFLSIANNHILDYKDQGMYDTIINLKRLGIKFSGAGSNLDQSRAYVSFNIKGKRIGIVSCSDHYSYWKSEPNKPGIYYVDYDNYEDLKHYISDIQEQFDILILSIHWGANYKRGLLDKYQLFAKDMLESGVDIIHGHSSHHVKCIRHDGKKIIMYGMGDFIDDYAISDEYRNDLGMVVSVIISLDQNNNKILIIPTKIIDLQVNVLTDLTEINYVYNTVKDDCTLPHIPL